MFENALLWYLVIGTLLHHVLLGYFYSDMARSYLKRLPLNRYIGRQYVFWTLCIADRKTGWLDVTTHLRLRELMMHASWRYHVAFPVYCLMPDHAHFLGVGLDRVADQRMAMRFVRSESGPLLHRCGCSWQKQAFEHVLREADLDREALRSTIAYILANPQRKGLVEHANDWPYLGSVIPGYPMVDPLQDHLWRLVELGAGWMNPKRADEDGTLTRPAT